MAEEEVRDEAGGSGELSDKKPAVVKILIISIVAVVLIGGSIVTSILVSSNTKEKKIKEGSEFEESGIESLSRKKDSYQIWNLAKSKDGINCNLLEGGSVSITDIGFEWDNDDVGMFKKESPEAYLESSRIVFISIVKEFFNSKTVKEVKDINQRDDLKSDLRLLINNNLPTKYAQIKNIYLHIFYQER